MDRTRLVRLRWRLTGAWLWPCFAALTVIDAALIHWLPPEGDSESAIGGWLIATVLMLLAIVTVGPSVGMLLRRWRRDLPLGVARNYAATAAVFAVSILIAVAGIAHHSDIRSDVHGVQDASVRAEAYIGDHAPAAYQGNIRSVSTIPIEPPRIYRSCVLDSAGTRDYCVVVDLTKPFGVGVHFDGHEPNQILDEGVQ